MKKLFMLDEKYKNNIENYTLKDGISAILLFLIFVGLNSLLAVLWMNFQIIKDNMRLSLNILNLFLIFLTMVFVAAGRQKMDTIGLFGGKWGKSLVAGLILALIFVPGNFAIDFLLNRGELAPYSEIMYLAAYFFAVAFLEEIVFRGYIQTRIHGIVKNKIMAVLLVALMFTVMHFPFGMIQNGWGLYETGEYIANNLGWVINLFIMHVAWDFIYKKTNSIYGPIIAHWLGNLMSNLLVYNQ